MTKNKMGATIVQNRTIVAPMIFWEKQKLLTALYERMTRPVCEKYGLTQMEYDIVMFLHNNPQFKTATDIVKMRKITKSHVSSGLSGLEEKGYIKRHYADGNKKTVILEISDSSDGLVSDGERAQSAFGQALFDGFSSDEMERCRELFLKMCENANSYLMTMTERGKV